MPDINQGTRTRQIKIITPGQRFGRLTAIAFIGSKKWHCRCDCGTEKNVAKQSLLIGATQSCGCLHRERTSAANGTHRASDTIAYRRWKSMLGRCTRKNSADWPNYGGRGISVCERWAHSFENFLADMGECPSKEFTLERNNCDGNYDPSNCRWATRTEQARNTTRNRALTHDGKTLCVNERAQITGLSQKTITARLNRGKTDVQALSLEIQKPAFRCLHGELSYIPCAQCEQEIEATTP